MEGPSRGAHRHLSPQSFRPLALKRAIKSKGTLSRFFSENIRHGRLRGAARLGSLKAWLDVPR